MLRCPSLSRARAASPNALVLLRTPDALTSSVGECLKALGPAFESRYVYLSGN